MKLYTSRYANRELMNPDVTVVAISRGLPKYETAYKIAGRIWDIAPARELYGASHFEFRRAYLRQLEVAGFQRIRRALAEYRDCGTVVLCCFEDVRNPEDWCHRRMFAEWWERHTGQKIEEYPDPSTPKSQKNIKPPVEVEEPAFEQMRFF